MNFKGYHHIGLMSKDAEKSLKFYTEGLGGTAVFSFPHSDKTIYLVDMGGNAVVEILPMAEEGDENNARWAHIALCTDDARAAFDAAIKAGAIVRSAPKDMSLGEMDVTIAFVYGPDKEVIEFFQVR